MEREERLGGMESKVWIWRGKTGTVQLRSFSVDEIYKKCLEMPLRRRHHGWFVGFAPLDEPRDYSYRIC